MGLKRGVRGSGENPVEPGLLILMAGCGECGTRELLVVKTIRGFLGRVGTYRQCPFNCFGPIVLLIPGPLLVRCLLNQLIVGIEAIHVSVLLGNTEF